MATLFDPQAPILAPTSDGRQFPVRRVFCIGQNYAAHAREMGSDPDKETAFFFTKWAEAVVPSGTTIVYPPETTNYHYEVEMVVAIGRGGQDIAAADALGHIYGYAVGLDMTRRDLQTEAKKAGRPWDAGKNVEQSAPLGLIHPIAETGSIDQGRIALTLNGEVKQDSDLSDMIRSIPELIEHVSRFYHLEAGDLIYTGTPSGVGPVKPGDEVVASVAGLSDCRVTIGNPRNA